MGIFIIFSIFLSYYIGKIFVNDLEILTLIILAETLSFFVIAFIIIKSFENLAEANKMKSDFVNIISHQLRTPLTNIKWTLDFIDLDKSNPMTDKQKEYFRVIKDNTERMIELSKDLIITSKMESKNVYPLKKEFFFFRKADQGRDRKLSVIF